MWNKNYPLATTSVSGSVAPDPNSQIRDNWDALEDWWDVDHQTFTSAGSGGHVDSTSGIILLGTNAEITGATAPGTGAIGYDTTQGQSLIYRSTGWGRLTANKYSRIRVAFGEQSIPASLWTKLATGATASGTYDTLVEFNTATFRFVALNSGFYFIKATIRFPSTTNNYLKGIGLAKNSVFVAKSSNYGSSVRNIDVCDCLSLVSGDYVELHAYHDHTSSVSTVNASLQMIRLS